MQARSQGLLGRTQSIVPWRYRSVARVRGGLQEVHRAGPQRPQSVRFLRRDADADGAVRRVHCPVPEGADARSALQQLVHRDRQQPDVPGQARGGGGAGAEAVSPGPQRRRPAYRAAEPRGDVRGPGPDHAGAAGDGEALRARREDRRHRRDERRCPPGRRRPAGQRPGGRGRQALHAVARAGAGLPPLGRGQGKRDAGQSLRHCPRGAGEAGPSHRQGRGGEVCERCRGDARRGAHPAGTRAGGAVALEEKDYDKAGAELAQADQRDAYVLIRRRWHTFPSIRSALVRAKATKLQ